jgi:hypothetical protein
MVANVLFCNLETSDLVHGPMLLVKGEIYLYLQTLAMLWWFMVKLSRETAFMTPPVIRWLNIERLFLMRFLQKSTKIFPITSLKRF